MKHSSFLRSLSWLLIAFCPPLLGDCGGSTEPGTETGNPPGVEQQKLHIVLRGTGVEVVGDPGAVSPGASVSVINRSTGDHAEATAQGDGSVSVSVPGSLQDEYDVIVSKGGASQTVQVMAATGTGNTDLASASCNALEDTLVQLVSTDFSKGNSACRTDDDCVYVDWQTGCYSECGGSYLSTSGANDTGAQIVKDTTPVCNQLAKRCTRPESGACAPLALTTVPECANGVCQALELGSYSCDELANSASARVNVLLDAAGHDCTRDSDCTLYDPSLACVTDCGRSTAIAAAGLPALTGSIQRLEGRFCGEFTRRSCPGPFALPCPAPPMKPQASCVAGQCTVTFTPF